MPFGVCISTGPSQSHSRYDSFSVNSCSYEELPEPDEVHKDHFDRSFFERRMSVIQIKRPTEVQPETQIQVEAEIKPKSAMHLLLLQGCAGFSVAGKQGSVELTLSKEFLHWAGSLDLELVEQAYLDAIYLSGKANPSLADCLGLNTQAQVERNWGEADIISLHAIRNNSRRLLKEFVSIRENKTKFSRSDLKDFMEDYMAATGGAKLAEDYQYLQRARRFRHEIIELQGKMETPKKLAQAFSALQHRVPSGKTELVLAFKRLHMLFEQRDEFQTT